MKDKVAHTTASTSTNRLLASAMASFTGAPCIMPSHLFNIWLLQVNIFKWVKWGLHTRNTRRSRKWAPWNFISICTRHPIGFPNDMPERVSQSACCAHALCHKLLHLHQSSLTTSTPLSGKWQDILIVCMRMHCIQFASTASTAFSLYQRYTTSTGRTFSTLPS